MSSRVRQEIPTVTKGWDPVTDEYVENALDRAAELLSQGRTEEAREVVNKTVNTLDSEAGRTQI